MVTACHPEQDIHSIYGQGSPQSWLFSLQLLKCDYGIGLCHLWQDSEGAANTHSSGWEGSGMWLFKLQVKTTTFVDQYFKSQVTSVKGL